MSVTARMTEFCWPAAVDVVVAVPLVWTTGQVAQDDACRAHVGLGIDSEVRDEVDVVARLERAGQQLVRVAGDLDGAHRCP